MNCSLSLRLIGAAAMSCVALSSPAVFGQSFHVVQKTQVYAQTSASGAVPDAIAPFVFSAGSAANATLTLPSGATQPLTFRGGSGSDTPYELAQAFSSKPALDAAFPNGTYRLSGSGIPTLSFNLTTDNYPAATPQVTGGNWNAGGVLVIDPTQSTTLNFSTFSTYASAGIGGHMEFNLNGLTDQVELSQQATSVAIFGQPAVATPFTSFTIPAGRLTSGRVYQVDLQFQTATTLDTTTAPGAAAAALWGRVTQFYIAALAPGATPAPAPTIASQPANVVAPVGGSATFSVNVPGLGPTSNFGFQWFFNGQQINFNGTKYVFNGPSITINGLTAADAGSYLVRVINTGGVTTSNPATLTIGTGGGSVAIVRQPVSQTVAAGSTVVFSVAATAPPGIVTYDWRFNGTSLPASVIGAGSPIIVLPNVTASQAGNYSVAVTSGGNPVNSNIATLAVSPNANDPGRLINLSILTPLAAGEQMTMGTVIGGGSGPKPLLARAAGPSLVQLGVTGFLPDPTMTLINANTSASVATNNDWGGTAALTAAFVSVGAFPYASATSRDAALFQSGATALDPGNYTVQVRDAGSGSGTVIAELYDATPGGTFTSTTPRLINVSVLKQIAAGTSLTAGFVVGGSSAKTVLIRAIGPTLGLAPFNIGGAMADPQLTLNNTSAGTVVATNNDWGGYPAIVTVANRVGAFAVANNNSRDAMLLVTLAPGNYTAEVSPVSGSGGGTAIVEVYEVP